MAQLSLSHFWWLKYGHNGDGWSSHHGSHSWGQNPRWISQHDGRSLGPQQAWNCPISPELLCETISLKEALKFLFIPSCLNANIIKYKLLGSKFNSLQYFLNIKPLFSCIWDYYFSICLLIPCRRSSVYL